VADRMVLTRRRYTIDEFMDLPENTARTELIDGIPVERMPAGGDHGEVVKVVERWLDRAELAGYGRRYSGPTGAVLDPDGARQNVREPDVYFYRQGRRIRRTSKGMEGVPDLVIEILSPGNRADDLPGGSVWRSYERFAVPDYWIVDYEARMVIQHRHDGSRFEEVARLRSGDVLRYSLFPTLPLPVDDLFRELDT